MRFSRILFVLAILSITFCLSCSKSSPTGPKNEPPKVAITSTSPVNGATNVLVSTTISATFSVDVDASTVNASTFMLNNGVTGTVMYVDKVATLTPTHVLASATSYTATLTTGIKDPAGNALGQNYTWSFTTGVPNTWVRTYGNGYETARAVVPSNDGGFFVSGLVFGGTDSTALYKVDAGGALLWRKTYGGGRGGTITTGSDGHIAMTFSGADSVGFLLVDNAGNVLQQKRLVAGYSSRISPIASGGYYIAGMTSTDQYSDIVVVKVDGSGALIWQKTFGGSALEDVGNILSLSDGCMIVGSSSSFGGGDLDVLLLKLNGSGNILFQKTFGGTQNDHGYNCVPTTGGGFLLCGESSSYGGGEAGLSYVVKVDLNGTESWHKTYGANSGRLFGMVQNNDNSFVFSGYGHFSGQGYDALLMKVDASGNQLWLNSYNVGQDEMLYGLISTSDGGYLAVGKVGQVSGISGNALFIKADASGNW